MSVRKLLTAYVLLTLITSVPLALFIVYGTGDLDCYVAGETRYDSLRGMVVVLLWANAKKLCQVCFFIGIGFAVLSFLLKRTSLHRTCLYCSIIFFASFTTLWISDIILWPICQRSGCTCMGYASLDSKQVHQIFGRDGPSLFVVS